ncbi:MAG: 3-phosphoshikimate 1-carboxyvinyltransferase [Acidiferrobacterales bacterium]
MTASPQKPQSPVDYLIEPGGKLTGRLRVPGDKSISHRCVMLGALADGQTRVNGLLEGEDVLATLAAFRAMGVEAEGPKDGSLVIQGVGVHGLRAPAAALDMGNSGTAMRLMAGILAGQAFDSVLSGDESLSNRPMRRVAEPLAAMGARIETADGGKPPLRIRGGQRLHGIDYRLPVPSAQVKSALLLAGLYAGGVTRVSEPAPTRDHTERMLRGFGYPVDTDGSTISLRGGGALTACAIDVPADISSAAFFLVGAAITPGSDLVLEHVGVNPTRIGMLNILRAMGAAIEVVNERTIGGEPVADLRVTGGRLHGISIPQDQVPLAIDEFPALFIAAACAEGQTRLSGAGELRVKESDRIAVMAEGLQRLGVDSRETPDGIIIQGGNLGLRRDGAEVDSHGDHRVAMAFAMAALRAGGAIRVRDCRNVATSFPGFASLAARAGLAIRAIGPGAG